MVVGSVGSGKSSLGNAILGEMKRVSGKIRITGSIAYVSQEAWILNETVKDNILFGLEYDPNKYNTILKAVCLDQDFESLPAGDMTEIGERGINLSGGQKQRISIARALYSDRDIYILDDVLSAVDVHVGRHIFTHALANLLKKKTILLVSNQLHYLPHADNVIVMENGFISEQGPYEELISQNGHLFDMMNGKGIEKEDSTESEEQVETTMGTKSKKVGSLTTAEEKDEGNISKDVYWFYIKYGSIFIFFCCLFVDVLYAGSNVASSIWLQYWPQDYIKRNISYYNSSDPNRLVPRPQGFYIGIYAAFNFSEALFTALVLVFILKLCFKASIRLHKDCISSTIKAKISFFDTTPVGRVISRFSTDFTYVDIQMAGLVWLTLTAFFVCLATLVAMTLGAVYLWIAVPPFAVIYYKFQAYYRKSSIELQRIESLSRSPVYSQFSETLAGVSTIRAYSLENKFIEDNQFKIDDHNADYFAQLYCTSWFGLRLDMLGTSVQFLTYLVIVLTKVYDPNINAGLATVSISISPLITNALSQLSQSVASLETKMNAVERIREYILNINHEAPSKIRSNRFKAKKGSIRFNRYSMRYRDGQPLVLHKIKARIKGGQKIGIVGRTGAGKSSILSGLYRMCEPASGCIEIDGVDISTIGLKDLRRSLAIIPQDPVMFIGTLRYNLDPFDEYKDHHLWHALEIVELRDMVESLEEGLESEVLENGDNFSLGQKQLMCMARALLRKSKILLLDEATASVDMKTDDLIQLALRNNFETSTVIIIAHRLNTIMDVDKIMVMEKGRLVEFDTPTNLLSDQTSIFYDMVQATGPTSAKQLTDIAFGREDQYGKHQEYSKTESVSEDKYIIPNDEISTSE
eukprot:TRINITY_DN6105_c0_g1_i2.p1 TRINITY_DN6105_c0_g1~~TRINITY_DN6105_c0_g1_i2.p1  ORF type:complete len:864 (-),score=163.95 TRINITY_DN6105_c0_g1_i2:58-2649(-)